GPFTGRSAPLAVRTRNFATPASRNSMYWLFTEPFTVFSNLPPFCPARVGRALASTDTALVSTSRGLAATVIAGPVPGKVAAVSALVAPAWPRLTPESTVPTSPLPLASAAAVLPAGSPRRQNALG